VKDLRTGRSHSGFIRFNNIENATKALETLNGTQTPNGENLVLEYARAPKAPLEPPSNTIFVANLPPQATDNDVRQTFSQFGEIIGVRLRAYFFS
jgi:RNA recognition motif-containing protein